MISEFALLGDTYKPGGFDVVLFEHLEQAAYTNATCEETYFQTCKVIQNHWGLPVMTTF